MSVFDTLAELRYEQWQKTISASGYQPPPARTRSARRQSYEAYLYSEVLLHLDKAAEVPDAGKRVELLQEAGKLEFQLMLLLERRNMPLAAATLRNSIAEHRQKLVDSTDSQP